MNRILIKDFFIEIWKTRKRFLSIFLIVALGCGFFAGIHVTGSDMKYTLDSYFQNMNFMDAQVLSPYGLVDGDLEAIRSLEDVTAVDPAYLVDLEVMFGEGSLVTRFHSYSSEDHSQQFSLVEGRLPSNPGECLIEAGGVLSTNLPTLGDRFRVRPGSDSEDIEDYLYHRWYTVVGTVHSPLYISTDKGASTIGSGSLDTYVFLPEAEFALEEYPVAYLYGDMSEETFSEVFEAQAEILTDELEELSDWRGPLRHQELKDKVLDAEEELITETKKAEEEIADAEVKLLDAQMELADGEREYADGVQEFHDEIAKAETELEDARRELDDAHVDYKEGEETYHREIADAERKLDDALIQLEDGEQQYFDGRDEYLKGYREYRDNKEMFDALKREALPQLQAGRKELEESKKLLDSSRTELDQGQAQVDQAREGWQKVDAGEAELLRQRQELAAFQGALNIVNRALTDPASITPGEVSMVEQIDAGVGALLALYLSDPTDPTISGQLQGAADQMDATLQAGQAAIDAAQAELDAIKQQLPPKAMLDILQGELDEGERQYRQGLTLYEEGLAEIKAGEEELAFGEEELRKASVLLSAADYKLTLAWEELEEGNAEYNKGIRELNEARTDGLVELADAYKKIQDGEKEYADGLVELADAKIEGQQELDDAWQEIKDGKQKILDAQQEVADGKKELRETVAKHQKDIDDAKETIQGITSIEWMVTSRDQSFSVREFGVNAERIDAIAAIFPVFFLAIAVLVSLTTMTRMVEDQRVQVGTLKSLGYSNTSIILKFMGYAFLASLFGSIFGLAICLEIFPRMIYTAFSSILYITPPIITRPHLEIALPTIGVAIAATTLSTFFVCYRMLQEQPAQLLRPEAPKPGKRILLERITPIWKRLKFNQKVTFRNLFRYKKRMLMSIVGVAGCTALMLAGFALQDAIGGFIDTQFKDIVHYDMEVYLDEEEDVDSFLALSQQYKEIFSAVSLHANQVNIPAQRNFNAQQDAELRVFFQPEDATKGLSLMDIDTEEPLALTSHGVIISEKLAKLYDLKTGDTFLMEEDDRTLELEVAGITQNYLFHYIYMDATYYQQVLGSWPEINRQYLGVDPDLEDKVLVLNALSSELLKDDAVLTVMQTRSIVEATSDLMESLDTIVYVLIFSAGLLAFIVMYNLTNINITERLREIATLKVLGFYDRETSSYISGENMILALIGAFFGLGLGVFLSRFIIQVAEVDNMLFLKKIQPRSFILSVALTLIFTLIVRVISHFQLKKIDMIESLQSGE